MKSRNFKAGRGKYRLTAVLIEAGRDVVLAIAGGTCYHAGATAVASPRPSLTGKGKSASVSVLCQLGHCDDEFARPAARRLSIVTGGVAVVTVGIHIDHAEQQELIALQENFEQLLYSVQQYLMNEEETS